MISPRRRGQTNPLARGDGGLAREFVDEMITLIERCRERYPDRVHLAGSMPEERIACAEQDLRVRFPSSYRAFLTRYGAGIIAGHRVLGLGTLNESVVSQTRRAQQDLRLPRSLIVVETVDAWLYCLDTYQTDESGEAPGVRWIVGEEAGEQDLTPIYRSFADFVVTRLMGLVEGDPRGGVSLEDDLSRCRCPRCSIVGR